MPNMQELYTTGDLLMSGVYTFGACKAGFVNGNKQFILTA